MSDVLSKLVELNIRHGGGSRIAAIRDWLDRQRADVIVLTEWRDNLGGRGVRDHLERAGYSVRGLTRGGSCNGLLFASRGPFSERVLTPDAARHGELAAFRIVGDLMLAAAYLPQRLAQIPFLEACGQLAATTSEPLLILGDMNTGCNLRDRDPAGAAFYCSAQFTALSGAGTLTDLWRHSQGEEAREWTWHAAKTGNGFRIDHALGNTALLTRYPSLRCRYDHSTRETGLTDHSALVVELDPDQ